MASSSVVPKRRKGGWIYDVFLSFRGRDTRHSFVDHLYAELVRSGISVFKDDEMVGGGKSILEEHVKAIKESRLAVVVFSENYATSSLLLEELSTIMECRTQMKVFPVFYHVDPSHVRKQIHRYMFKGEMDKVNKYSAALSAADRLSRYHILPDNWRTESEIVEEILADIQPPDATWEDNLVGIEPRIDALISLLKMEATEEVRIVGIWGVGGIGKTTIARALIGRIVHKFDGSSFVANVRENSCSGEKDICALQKKILEDIIGEHRYKIETRDEGAEIIQEICCIKKVLLVLDDVNDVKQLEFLAATHAKWFRPGSRIIITTRDQHLLSSYADEKYKPATLSEEQAVVLFSRHAFLESSPPEGYKELSIRAIRYTGGLPLALKVLGSLFLRRPLNFWKSSLDRLVEIPDKEVYDILKLSFSHLDVSEQEIFLDIACFHKRKNLKDVTAILDSFGFDPVIGISVLIEKCLITVSNDKLDMHDLIQEMGWKVVQESAPNSRLEQLEKIHHYINNRKLELGIVREIGKLSFSDKEIGNGSNGTIVREGMYDTRRAAVKCVVKWHHDNFAFKEIENLLASDHHVNIVRYYGVENDNDFVYIALERCICSLHELILSQPNPTLLSQLTSEERESFKVGEPIGYPSPELLKVMRDTIAGLAHLHKLGIIHRDLKPQNVLICKYKYSSMISAKVSDMGISKCLPADKSSLTSATGYGSLGWQAPETLCKEPQITRAVDLFSLGCLLFFCITGGRHPFGDDMHERDINIKIDCKDLSLVDNIPEALDLASNLIHRDPESRPSAAEVYNHPLFWDPKMRLDFFHDASRYLHNKDRKTDPDLQKELKRIDTVVLDRNWNEELDKTFLSHIQPPNKKPTYDYTKVSELVRLIRNKSEHDHGLPGNVPAALLDFPTGYEGYFRERFPKLLIEIYKVLKPYCGEKRLKKHYEKTLDY